MATQKVEENTDEYNQIFHYLSMCLDKSGMASDLQIWKIINAETTAKFERRSGSMLRVPCWVDSGTLPDGDDLDSICNFGFRFQGISGHTFRSGVNNFGVEKTPLHCQVIYCEVAVGRSHVTDAEPENVRIPTGFDSLYISREKLDRNADGEFSIAEYQAAANFDYRDAMDYTHEYFIRDPLLVLPKYIINFTITPTSNFTNTTPAIPASLIAPDGGDFEYFDPVQYRPVSTVERQSNPQLARRLVTIPQAYQFAAEEARKQDATLIAKVEWIDTQLEKVDDRVREVAINYAEAHEAITLAAQQAIRDLQAISRDKMELLLGMELELRREKEEINWAEYHIKNKLKASASGASGVSSGVSGAGTSRSGKDKENKSASTQSHLSPIQTQLQFLQAWKSHAVLRNGLSRLHPVELQTLHTILPDVQVHANIDVVSESSIALSQQYGRGGRSASSAVGGGNRSSTGATRRRESDPSETVGDAGPGRGPQTQRDRSESPQPLQSRKMSVEEQKQRKSFELSQFLQTAKQSSLYSEPPSRPAETLVSPATQALVDVNLSKIAQALTAVLEESASVSASGGTNRRVVPLPMSITRPNVSGASYSLPGLVALPTPDSAARRLKMAGTSATLAAASGASHANSETGSEMLWMSDGTLAAELEVELRGLKVAAGQRETGPPEGDRQGSVRKGPNSLGSGLPFASPMPAGKGFNSLSLASPGRLGHHDEDDRGDWQGGDANVLDEETAAIKIEQLQTKFASYKSSYGISTGAQRRQKQMSASNFKLSEKNVFFGTSILQPMQAQELYFTVPFFSRPPECKLLYTTTKQPRGLSFMLKACAEVQSPVVLLISSGSFTCGAYLNQAPVPTGAWSGSPACFLFSATLDLKFPYHGRKPPARGKTDFPCGFLVDMDHLEVGNGDLHIESSLTVAYSELEGCYGFGLSPRSEECVSALGGSSSFPIDILELWQIASISL